MDQQNIAALAWSRGIVPPVLRRNAQTIGGARLERPVAQAAPEDLDAGVAEAYGPGTGGQGQNFRLAMAAPWASDPSFAHTTSGSTPPDPTWMLNPQSTAAITLSRPASCA